VIHSDTSFVVDFLREASRNDPGPATAMLDSLPPEDLAVSVFAVCELLAGAALAQRGDEERQKVREFCATLRAP
jgi:predicted nucleic acid-binding protein